jgi:hypothetical protein
MMNRFLVAALAVAVSIGTTAVLANGNHARAANQGEMNSDADGAYRDGIFVGRLAAERGQASRPPVGRRSSERDRVSFAAGYRRGYGRGGAERVGE